MNEILDAIMNKSKYEVYENMYQSLFRDTSNVLTVLKSKDTESVDTAIKLLENAQCKAEEIFVDTEQFDSDNSLYTDIFKRTNLQSIGYFLKEGSLSKSKNPTSFSQRENLAEKELEEELGKLLNEETINKIYPSIVKYTSTKEEIQFSLGMKIGAKLLLLLITDSEHDFCL